MKKNITISSIILIFLFLSHTVLFSQTQHFITVSGAGGYATLLDNIEETNPAFGYGAAVGVGYELQKKHFIFNLGVEGDWERTVNELSNSFTNLDMIDSEGDPFVLNCKFANRIDRVKAINISVPIMIGCQFNRFYALVGAKLRVNVSGKTDITSSLTTTGTYPQFIVDFENMPNHGLASRELQSAGVISFKPHAVLAAELGFKLNASTRVSSSGYGSDNNAKQKVQYRLGAFANYGLTNMNTNNSAGELLTCKPLPDTTLDIHMNHIYASDLVVDKAINNLFAGIKFTVLFQLPETKSPVCVICEEYFPTKRRR